MIYINSNFSTNFFNFFIGFNYIIKLEKKESIALNAMEKLDNYISNGLNHNYQYFFKISPLNCDVSLKEYNSLNIEKNVISLNENEIFQDKLYLNAKHYRISDASKDDCLLYITSYNIKETISSEYSNGIIFGNNTSQTFLFNSANNEFIFSFAHIELENDVKIQFKQIDKKTYEYEYDIKVNEEFLEEKQSFNDKTKDILLKSKEIKRQCDSEFMCKILVRVKTEDKDNESRLKITFTSVNGGDDDDEESDKPSDKPDDESDKPSDKPDDESDKPSEEESDNPSEEENGNPSEEENGSPNDNPNQNNDENPKKKKNDDDDDDNKVLIVVLLIVGAVIIIGVAIGLYFYFRVYSKNKDLSAAVNQISFKDNDKNNDDDEIGDSLLD